MANSTPEVLCTPEDLSYALTKLWDLMRQGATVGVYVQDTTLHIPSQVASVTNEGKLVLYNGN